MQCWINGAFSAIIHYSKTPRELIFGSILVKQFVVKISYRMISHSRIILPL